MMDEADHGLAQSTIELKLLARAESAKNFQARRVLSQNFFKGAEWTPDGTSVVSNSEDNHIRTFIVPPDLLEPRLEPLILQPYSTIPSTEPVNAQICYPGFDLQDPATTLVLSTASDHPIRLNSALTGHLVASYPLVSPTTEAYIKPQSLLFTGNRSTFVAGSDSLLCIFDVSRPGEGPASSFKTGPKRTKGSWSNPGTALKGLISALDVDQEYSVLAAGTLSRQIGLYDHARQGECIGAFSVAGTKADETISGSGITQVSWSRCGRYLHVIERKSHGTMIYDIRKTGQLLSWTVGRNAMTNQRMKVELAVNHDTGDEDVWAGGSDGCVRLWKAPHLHEGAVEAGVPSKAHDKHVNSLGVHATGNVLVTAAGSRDFEHATEASQLRIWEVKSTEG